MPLCWLFNARICQLIETRRTKLVLDSNKNGPTNCLITGASRRIGAAIASTLAANGCNLIIHHNASDSEAKALCDDLAVNDITATAISADLTKTEDCEALFDQAASTLGTIDLLINNASIFSPDKANAFDAGTFKKHFDIHVKAPSILAGAMANQAYLKSGLIVNLIDQRVKNLNPNFYSYTLSKSALWTATQTLAQALAPKIRVNAIGPGPTLPNKRQEKSDFDRQVDGLLLKRSPQLPEFGETVMYFWKNQSITGQMIALDGGQHLAWETPDIAGITE